MTIVEIGVDRGGSLMMWENYFGEQAKIIGIDINPECAKISTPNVQVFIGSQSDRNFLQFIKTILPKIDILIDDGGHLMDQQIITFEEMFPHISDGGIYICEDLHTSYWAEYGGGLKKPDTFIEYAKNFIDYLHGFLINPEEYALGQYPNGIPYLTEHMNAVHYYDSMVVIEKKKREMPRAVKSGQSQL